MSQRVEFVERRLPMIGAAFIFVAMGAYLVWDMFIQGANPDMVLQFLDATPSHPIAWLALLGVVFMVGLLLWRITFARNRIILEGDVLRFGVRGSRELRRQELAGVDLSDDKLVRLQLAQPVSAATRERAQLPDDVEDEVVLLDERLVGDGPLGPAVERWLRYGEAARS
jgi:hypothetical protein